MFMLISPESAHKSQQKLSRHWLLLAIASLAVAGLLSLPPVILRGSWFEAHLPTKLIFDTSLILHVNLSVLVWLLAITSTLWSLSSRPYFYFIYKALAWTATVGLALMACSIFFTAEGLPVKNNYVPMLQNVPFIMGLALLGAAILIQAVMVLLFQVQYAFLNPLHFGMYSAAGIIVLTFIGFGISSSLIEPFSALGALTYYEHLFWAGGHILQFAYVTLLLVAWLWNAGTLHIHPVFSGKYIKIIFGLHFVLVAPAIFVQLQYDNNYESLEFFTRHMREAGGIAAAIIGIPLLWKFLTNISKQHLASPVFVATFFSIILFGGGGLIGLMIEGTNTIIPSHYHGSIVGITLACIGLTYHLLPALGYGKIKGKLATAQPWVYGVGQILHVGGLALMGGYGALRKAPGTIDSIDTLTGKLMFLTGGALAVLRGVLLIIGAYRSIFSKQRNI